MSQSNPSSTTTINPTPQTNNNRNQNRNRYRRYRFPKNTNQNNPNENAADMSSLSNASDIYAENLNALNRTLSSTNPQQQRPQQSHQKPRRPKTTQRQNTQSAPLAQNTEQQHQQAPQPKQQQQQTKTSSQLPHKRPQKPVTTTIENRTDFLIEQLTRKKYECMICCSMIRADVAIWSCAQCYHMFHLYCIKKWSRSQLTESTDNWRCPTCQHQHKTIPNHYKCFCGKKTNPEYNDQQIAHSCGEVCAKNLKNPSIQFECTHKCTILCHPGPCPTCEAIVSRKCGCGKVSFQVKCSSNRMPVCNNSCAKLLNCGRHKCERNCHDGPCDPCAVTFEQSCESHSKIKTVLCSLLKTLSKKYECAEKCSRTLNCGIHSCERSCHAGKCDPCELLPENVKTCSCGKTRIADIPLAKKRVKCTDPLATCSQKCLKVLQCSTGDDIHFCEALCHEGECPKCEKVIRKSCRCGSEVETLKCNEASEKYKDEAKMCRKKCQARKSCGRHKCSTHCCDNNGEHICMLVCDRPLSCGNHKCEQLCHKGNCPRCLVASFDEWHCNCGLTIVYPPIKCGTRMPECPHPCQRIHQCDHPVSHNCHSSEQCPPCSYLTSKPCMGKHEIRANIPCYIKEFSCGMPCGKQLPCGMHKCQKTCHKGECLTEGEKCVQPCTSERPHCSHLCLSACHVGEKCPDTVCQAVVTLKCKCGLRSLKSKCLQRTYDTSAVVFENLASELKDMLTTKTINLSSFTSSEVMKKKTELECDEECLLAERNRALAQALQIDAEKQKQSAEETVVVPLDKNAAQVKMPHVSMDRKVKSISNKWTNLAEREPGIEIKKSPYSVLMDIDSDHEKELMNNGPSKHIDYFDVTD